MVAIPPLDRMKTMKRLTEEILQECHVEMEIQIGILNQMTYRVGTTIPI